MKNDFFYYKGVCKNAKEWTQKTRMDTD